MKSLLQNLFLTTGFVCFCSSIGYCEKIQPRGIVSCPRVVADKATGSFSLSTSKKKDYKCYSSAQAAIRDGFSLKKNLKTENYSGWWRLKFSKITDTCGQYNSRTSLVLFVQILQSQGAVFADFCPTFGRQVGARSENGLSVSRTSVVRESAGPLSCSGDEVEITEQLNLNRIVEGNATHRAVVTRIRRCPNLDEGAITCSTTFDGIAFPETHPIWPTVQQNTNKLGNGCTQALNTCQECHANLIEPPQNP